MFKKSLNITLKVKSLCTGLSGVLLTHMSIHRELYPEVFWASSGILDLAPVIGSTTAGDQFR